MNRSTFFVATMATLIITTWTGAQDGLRSDIDPFSNPAPDKVEKASYSEDIEPSKSSFLPKLNFGKSGPKKPSLLNKMHRNTKQMMHKSKGILMPWTRKSEQELSFTGLKKKPEKKKSKFLANLLKPFPDEPAPITTADDWFRQPKPSR